MENGFQQIWEKCAEQPDGSLGNPANREGAEDGGGRLAAVYNAGMDLKRGPAGFQSPRKEADLMLHEEDFIRAGYTVWVDPWLSAPN